MLLDQHQRPTRKGHNTARATAVVGLIVAATVCLVTHGLAADRRLSRTEAQAIADAKLAPLGIAVEVDDLALDGVNRILTGGRRSFMAALERLDAYRVTAAPVLAVHGVPEPLLAIALAESGIGGPFTRHASPGAPGPRGIWQMLASTARNVGLRVDTHHDERFDPEREVTAVAPLLASLHQRLGNWPLAIAAYNMGPEAVERAIRTHGTKDPTRLREAGSLNGYLAASVVPAMLIVVAPETLTGNRGRR